MKTVLMSMNESEIWGRLSRVKIVGVCTILRARISSTPMRLITKSKTSSGSDVNLGLGRHDMIEEMEMVPGTTPFKFERFGKGTVKSK
jgi:hypothetical protein